MFKLHLKQKYLIPVFLLSALLLVLLCATAYGANDFEVYVNETKVVFPLQEPVMSPEGHFLVPLRFISHTLGQQVHWYNATQEVNIIDRDGQLSSLKIGDNKAFIHGSSVILETKPVIINDTCMVPLRFVCEALGANIQWDGANSRVYITMDGVHYDPTPANRVNKPTLNASDKDIYSREFLQYLIQNCNMFPYGQNWVFYNSKRPDDTLAGFEMLNEMDQHARATVGDLRIENHVLYNNPKTVIFLSDWNPNMQKVAKDVFKAYFPNDYKKLYALVDGRFNNKELDHFNKNLQFDGYTVYLYFTEYTPDDHELGIEIYKNMPVLPEIPPTSDLTSKSKIKYLVDNYGMELGTENGCFYIAQGGLWLNSALKVTAIKQDKEVVIILRGLYARLSTLTAGVLQTYLPNDWQKLYDMIIDFGKTDDQHNLEKYHTMDGYQVYMKYWETSGKLYIYITEK